MKRFMHAMVGLVALLGVSCLLWGCESELDKANALAKGGKNDLAAKMYQKVLKTDKKNVGAWLGLAKIYCAPGSYNGFRCLEAARKSKEFKAKDPKVDDWLKRALFTSAYDRTTSGELIKAEEYLKQYLALDSANGKAYLIGALIKKRMGSKPFDPKEIRKAIKRLGLAIKNSSKTDTMKLSPKDKVATPIQWEAYKMKGNLHELLIVRALSKFEKNKKKKGAKFKPNEADFQAAVAAYKKTHSLNSTQPKKKFHFYPLFQVAMLHVNYKNDNKAALDVLLKAEKSFPNSKNVLNGIRQIYGKMSKEAKGRRNRKKYKKLAEKYLAKIANLPKSSK